MAAEQVNITDEFREVLSKIKYPGFDLDIVSAGLVLEARREGAKAVVRLQSLAAPPAVREQLENDIAQAVAGLGGMTELELTLPEPPPPPKPKEGPKPVAGVAAIVPVASGKGGVGKSTVAVNLALGLRDLGLRVGLLDLDLYGPSLPIMLGIHNVEPGVEGNLLKPVEVQGLKTMSIGFLVRPDQALVWRGPLVMKAVRQLLHEVAWAPLDVLVLDLPPGTGDVQISMTQEVPIAGAVVVTTPQDVALADAVKGVDMFRTVGAPILGIVENMSYFICPDCSSRHEIFGHGSVEPLARRTGVEFLGEIPLDPLVPKMADQGLAALSSDTVSAEAYRHLAQRVKERLAELAAKEA
ncbi:MAG: Mrp/NBP35 family ATP-binding protein [Deltaproteobacteria bacterium]|nr:Mrp/NBP35 family ATP-binding protein [Deltaproteobacteria bacterium]